MLNFCLYAFLFLLPFLLMHVHPVNPRDDHTSDEEYNWPLNLDEIPLWENPLTWAIVAMIMALFLPCIAIYSFLFPKDTENEVGYIVQGRRAQSQSADSLKPLSTHSTAEYYDWCRYFCSCCFLCNRDSSYLSEIDEPVIQSQIHQNHNQNWTGLKREFAPTNKHRGEQLRVSEVRCRGISVEATPKEMPADSVRSRFSQPVCENGKLDFVSYDPSGTRKVGASCQRALPIVQYRNVSELEVDTSYSSYEKG